jgi:hypothetical protein
MKTCGTCRHWDDGEHKQPGIGICFGSPPTVLKDVQPVDPAKILTGPPLPPGVQPMQAVHRAVYPALPTDARACGCHEPRPENGEPE